LHDAKSNKPNIIQEKSYAFSVKAVNAYLDIKNSTKEFDLARQFMRSATSIGANIEESLGGFSKKDFIYKVQISYKEARETKYWLRLLRDTNIIDQEKAIELINDVEELIRILSAILRSSKNS